MSLFPAYSNNIAETEKEENKDIEKSNEAPEWLENSSYKRIAECLESLGDTNIDSSDEDLIEEAPVQNEHLEAKSLELYVKKKKKVKRKKLSHQYETRIEDVYFEDRERNKKFSLVETLQHTIRPFYDFPKMRLGSYPIRKRTFKREKFRRYYKRNIDEPNKKEDNKKEQKSKDENSEGSDNEIVKVRAVEVTDSQKFIVEDFNRKLAEFPEDINTWLQYVSFQDEIVRSSPFYSEKENLKKLTNQKKLAIIEKALTANPESIELLQMKLKVLSNTLPLDQYVEEIEKMIKKDPKNILLWETLVTLLQTSCALFSVPKVFNLYKKCFSLLKQKSRSNAVYYDRQVLKLLYQCLIFLRQAGFWEQMWEIVKFNLRLNLSLSNDSMQDVIVVDDKKLIHLEEMILISKLPLNQLWLRVELLRESCLWTSVDIRKVNIDLIGDEKRLVSTEEISDFIYPTLSRFSSFRLVILSILSLKVPLLPTRHSTLKDFDLGEHPWLIDTLEFILPMIYPNRRFEENQSVIKSLLEGKLVSGPQFLTFHPAQELFLDFIRLIFNTVAQSLPPDQRTSILIWWLRFERLLVFVSKSDPLMDKNRNKKLKSIVKDFLKKPENRNNLLFYEEYALIEYELGSTDSCIKTLKKVLESQNNISLNDEEKVAVLSLYRTLLEILLYDSSDAITLQQVVSLLKIYFSQCYKYDSNMPIIEILYNEILKFLSLTVSDESEETCFLPNIYCDLMSCYAYLAQANNEDIESILELFEKCIVHLESCCRVRERFVEAKVIFLQFCMQKEKEISDVLKKTVESAIDYFPSNFLFLSLNARTESEYPFWKMNLKCKMHDIWYILANCLAGRARIIHLKHLGFKESSQAMTNKMLSFHKILSESEGIQFCPLIWKFYILLIQEHCLCEKKGEEIYYKAITQCPWAKSIYLGASQIAPQVISQIQDLIKEKELRLYITPEELDILRE